MLDEMPEISVIVAAPVLHAYASVYSMRRGSMFIAQPLALFAKPVDGKVAKETGAATRRRLVMPATGCARLLKSSATAASAR